MIAGLFDELHTFQIFNGSILYNIAEHCPTAAENNEVLNHIHQVYFIFLQVFHRVEQGRSYSCYASNKMESYLNKLDVQVTSKYFLAIQHNLNNCSSEISSCNRS